MDYDYRITELEQTQERAELSEAIHQIWLHAVDGKWKHWDLEAVGGALLTAGTSYEDAQDVLDIVAAERRLEALKPYIHQAYALAAVALGAKVNGRLERALELALSGAVTLLGADLARVRSAKGNGDYYTVNGKCTCPDASGRAPMVNSHPACKHQLAVWLLRRAETLMLDALVWEA